MDAPAGPFERADPNVIGLKPWGWLPLYRIFRWLGIGPDDAMIDIGSGAGRAILVASLFPFRRVIGLEISDALHRLAQENLTRFRGRRRSRVELILGDALDYGLPADVTVIFLASPFGGATLRRFMECVFRSVDRAPRRLRLVYCNPLEQAYLAETGRCHLVKRFRGLRPMREWARMLTTHVYEIGPDPSSRSGPAGGRPMCRDDGARTPI